MLFHSQNCLKCSSFFPEFSDREFETFGQELRQQRSPGREHALGPRFETPPPGCKGHSARRQEIKILFFIFQIEPKKLKFSIDAKI